MNIRRKKGVDLFGFNKAAFLKERGKKRAERKLSGVQGIFKFSSPKRESMRLAPSLVIARRPQADEAIS